MTRKILVTGAAGYVGSKLVRHLLSYNYHIIGLDSLKYGDESISQLYDNPYFVFQKGDIRDFKLIDRIVNEVTDVVHLAAIVGDPACSKMPEEAFEVNWIATRYLFDACKNARNISHFVFASTCSNYGKMDNEEFLNENSELRPVSLYAKLKVKFEKYLLKSETRKDFYPTALRFATIFGASPRIRFDLTVNEFIRDAFLKRRLTIYGEEFWRPYCHVADIVRAIHLILESNPNKVSHEVFGVGDSNQNYQKKMIAEEILKIIPETNVNYIHKEEDPRNYKVDFSKIKNLLNFQITKTLPYGLNEIYNILDKKQIEDPYSKKYTNI